MITQLSYVGISVPITNNTLPRATWSHGLRVRTDRGQKSKEVSSQSVLPLKALSIHIVKEQPQSLALPARFVALQ